jgi:peptidoglycan pentaglycine glycine transferase (the first glycine)
MVLHRSILGLPIGGIFYASRGPVLDYENPLAQEVFGKILARLKKVAQRRLAFVHISPDIQEFENSWALDILTREGFVKTGRPIQHSTTLRLDLSASLDQIVARMEKRRRYEIRRYERDKRGWTIDYSNSRNSLDIFYYLYQRTMFAAQQKPKNFDHLLQMYRALKKSQSCFIFIANYQSCPVASAFIIATGKRLWYLYGGSDKDAGASGSGVILHWEIIKWAHSSGYLEYDLQGFPAAVGRDNPLYGIYLFKRGWGGQVVNLIGEFSYSPIPGLEKILSWYLH